MSNLGHYFRVDVQNTTSVTTGTVTVKARPWYWHPVLGKVYSAEQTWFNTTVAGTSTGNGSAVDNSNNGSGYYWEGADITVSYAAFGSSATGDVVVRLSNSTDGGTTWPDNNTGPTLTVATWAAATAATKKWGKV